MTNSPTKLRTNLAENFPGSGHLARPVGLRLLGLPAGPLRALRHALPRLWLCLLLWVCASQSASTAGAALPETAPTASAASAPAASLPFKHGPILVLQSFQPGLPVSDGVNRGILQTLGAAGIGAARIYIEHLDLARSQQAGYRASLAALLRNKFAATRFDVVIVVGTPAVNFIAQEGQGLFPDAALLTVTAVDISALEGERRTVLNIPWQSDPGGTLRAALGLMPGIRRVLVVAGAPDERVVPFRAASEAAFAPWKGKLEFEYTNHLSHADMLRRVAQAGPDTLVLFSTYFGDSTGQPYVPADVVAEVCKAAQVPVFGVLGQYLGACIAGGSLIETSTFGVRAGQVALDYLSGHLRPSRGVTTFPAPSRMMFDWNVLERWQLDPDRLPPQSTIINRPPTLWGQYKWFVSSSVATIVLLLFLLVGLLVQRRRRLEAEAFLRASAEELLQHRLQLESTVAARTAALAVATEEAQAASRAKSAFLSSMSHELRTPLNVILGFSELMDCAPTLAPQHRQQLGEILHAGRHMLSLVSDLIDLSQIEVGRLEIHLAPVDLRTAASEAVRMIGVLAEARGMVLDNRIAAGPGPAMVLADHGRLLQVILNLLSNAIKYSKSHGTVVLDCRPAENGKVRLTVSDSGPGIPVAKQGRLFSAFDRLGRENGPVEGSGIGLAISRRMVEAMGSTIGYDGGEGRGSVFWMEFPAVQPTVEAPAGSAPVGTATATAAGATPAAATDIDPPLEPRQAPDQSASLPATRLRVLYVEDNPPSVRLMERIADHLPQVQLVSAYTAESGIGMALALPPDLILLDIDLPDMDGYAALAILKADPRTAQVPVVAVTANAMVGEAERGVRAGFAGYLVKPFPVRTMQALLEEHVLRQHPVG